MKDQLKKLIEEYRSLQPFNEDCKRKLDKKFRLEFNYNSNHLEGNTLTYGETELLLIFDQTKGNHELRELEEMKAHDVALMLIKEEAAIADKPLTEKFIKELNQTILVRPFWKDAITSERQPTRRQIKVGEYKEYPNSVIQSNGEVFEYASPQETPILMAELVKWYNDEVEKKELSAIELAALLHYRYIRIHPFDDGNGRVARLLVNYVLFCNDLPPVIIKTADKKNYLRVLQQADSGDLQAFINYMTQQLAWSIDLSIKAAKGEEIEEQDDWEKQLILLKKGLGVKSDEVVKKSEESIKGVFDNVITPLCEIYDEKISPYNSVFMEYKYRVITTGKVRYNENVRMALDNIYKLNEFKTDIIIIDSLFNHIRKPYLENSISSNQIIITFEENAYVLKYKGKVLYAKLYSEFLSEEEMNIIISDIGKDLFQKIEKEINK